MLAYQALPILGAAVTLGANIFPLGFCPGTKQLSGQKSIGGNRFRAQVQNVRILPSNGPQIRLVAEVSGT